MNTETILAKAVDSPLGYVELPPGVTDPHAFALMLDGDCMLPKYRPGEILIFSRAAPVTCGSDCLVVLRTLGPGRVNWFKRVHFGPDGAVRLEMLNPKYGGTVIWISQPLEIIRCMAKVPASAFRGPPTMAPPRRTTRRAPGVARRRGAAGKVAMMQA